MHGSDNVIDAGKFVQFSEFERIIDEGGPLMASEFFAINLNASTKYDR